VKKDHIDYKFKFGKKSQNYTFHKSRNAKGKVKIHLLAAHPVSGGIKGEK
jgi:hypothetical protein